MRSKLTHYPEFITVVLFHFTPKNRKSSPNTA
jgi:hypothetical protein